MLALPIARRELLVLSRSAATWQKRLVSSVAVLLLGTVFALIYRHAGQMPLRQAIHALGFGLSMMCLFAGISLTADAFAEEKRAGTLGLLFLTRLTRLELALGKLIAHGVVGFYMVWCALPLLSMSMIFGGMRFGEVVRYALAALNILFFSAALGLFTSSVCRDKRRANALGTVIVVCFWVGLPMAGVFLNSIGAPRGLIQVIAHCSVNLFTPMAGGLGRLLPFPPAPWWNFAWPHVLGWAWLGLAVWRLSRGWQDEPLKRWRLREMWQALSYGTPAARMKLRRRLLDRNPFMWLASRDRLQVVGIWIITVALMGFIGFHFFRGRLEATVPVLMGISISVVLQLAFSAAAGAQLMREYEQGTLEIILSTPLTAREVLRGQFAAVIRQYRSLFGLTCLLLLAGVVLLFWSGGPARFPWVIALTIYSGLFLLQFYALGWLGMWCVVKATDPRKSASNAFFLITIFPGIMFGFVLSLASVLNWLAGTRFSPPPAPLIALFFVFAFVNCIYWLRRAKRELPRELRQFAYRRYIPSERPSLFGQLGKLAGRWFNRATTPRTRVLPDVP